MKKLFFILTILFFANIKAVVAQSYCSNLTIQPKVIFSTSYGKLRYDYSKSQDQLTGMGKKYGIVEQGLFAAGLATVGVHWEVSVSTVTKKVKQFQICVIPATIEVFIGYNDPVIYVARELKPDTCEYNVVMRHEQTHQQINKAALEYYIPELRYHVMNISQEIRPLQISRSNQVNEATEILTKQYIQEIGPLVEAFKKELMKEQGKLDNHSNYKLEGDLCKYYHKKQKKK